MVGVLPGLVVTKMMISMRNNMMMKIEMTMMMRRKMEQLHLRYSSIVPNISMVWEAVGHVSVKCQQSKILLRIGKISAITLDDQEHYCIALHDVPESKLVALV